MNVKDLAKATVCRVPGCSEPREGGTIRCELHRRKHAEDALRRTNARKAAGVCACGAARAIGFNRCQPCRDKQKKKQTQLRVSGVCIRCADKLAVAAGMCRRCWFRKIAGDCLRARGPTLRPTAEALELLWDKQSGACAFTGEKLVPGATASLDHILPQSRGGDHSIHNLQWVAFHVNIGKGNLTSEEFIAMCAQVVAHERKA